MTIKNAIKKLEKNGFMVTTGNTGNIFAVNPNYTRWIEVMKNGGGSEDVAGIDVRTTELRYHANTFCDNISQAIRVAMS